MNYHASLNPLHSDQMSKARQLFEQCIETLGSPRSRGESWAIYRADCLEIMPLMAQANMPLTITSPPYNIGKAYERIMPLDEYLSWCGKWIHAIYDLTADDGAFWLNLGYVSVPGRADAIPISYMLWDQIPFHMIQEVVWTYGAGVSARKSFSPRNEKFLWYVKNALNRHFDLDAVRDPDVKYPNQKKNGKLRCNPLGKNPGDVWHIPKVTSGRDRSSPERTAHPAQFPLAVIERIVLACSKSGDIVFDPFAGSGSSLEAALRHGRHGIGIEIREDYAALAASRLKFAEAQHSFF